MTPFEEQSAEDESALLENRPPRGHPLIAWMVIELIVVAVFVGQQYRPDPAPNDAGEPGGVDVNDIQSRYFVGVPNVLPLPKKQLVEHIEPSLYRGSYKQRLRCAIVAGEFGGPEEALKWLERLKNDPPTSPDISKEERRSAELLEKLYDRSGKKIDPGVLKPDEQEHLRKEMGWAGEVALAPEGGPDVKAREAALQPARKTAITVLGGGAGACGGMLVGFVALILVLIALFRGRARRGFVPGSPYGGIYAETFALWMLLFVGLMVGGMFLPSGRSKLFHSALLTLASLVVLAWPVWRGVPWKQVREDVGLSFFGQPLRQVLCGPVCYLSSLPLVLIGLLGMLVLVWLRSGFLAGGGGGGIGDGEGMHPIVHYLASADGWVLFQIFFAACVVAPVVEEIFFRGVLYRHLREATRRWAIGWSLLISGLVTSFVFAAIHPQGILGIPLLMSLAMGFTLTREWRGSLVPCMIAHGLNNGLVMLLAVNLFRN